MRNKILSFISSIPLCILNGSECLIKYTCSALQLHNGAIIACDEAACGELTVDTYKYFLDIERKERL